MRYTLELARYALGLRGPLTSVTPAETQLLRRLVAGARCVVEVGVYEGATSAQLLDAMEGDLYLVDPWLPAVRIERLLGASGAEWIARRTLKRFGGRARFVKSTSLEAAAALRLPSAADVIFIDAVHDYAAVSADFKAWTPHLKPGGVIALHDSRVTAACPKLRPTHGPVVLASELRQGLWGKWTALDAADSVTVFAAPRQDSLPSFPG